MQRLVYVYGGIAAAISAGIILYFSLSNQLPTQPALQNTIEIGAILPLTGNLASWGDRVQEGMNVAVDEINSENQLAGKKISIIYEDSQGAPDIGVTDAIELITVDHVPSIIGDVASSVTLAVLPIATENHVVLLSPTASAPALSNASSYFFRIWPSDNYEGGFIANVTKNMLGINKVCVIHLNNDYGVGLAGAFEKEFESDGGTILTDEGYNDGTTDFKTLLTKLESTNPDAIYMVTYVEDAALILRQAKELGINTQFIGVSVDDSADLIKGAGSAADGLIFPIASGYDPTSNSTEVLTFKNEFNGKYGKDPDYVDAQGYDAMKIMAASIEKGGYTGDDMRTYMATINGYHGAGGEITFDQSHDVVKPVILLEIKDGKFIHYEK